jgi:glycosyltransferase involved in cell wall biosynthesis
LGTVKQIHETAEEETLQKSLKDLGLKWPLISVVVTNYNYSRYLVPCLSSIQQQTYSRFECIIVDDASTDNSVEIVEDFIGSRKLDHQFLLVRRATNEGQLAAFRTGLQHCKGSFVVYVDADDLLHEHFLHAHLNVHLTDVPAAFTCSNQQQINEHGEILGGVHPGLRVGKNRSRVLSLCLFGLSWVWATTSSMMFRRATLEVIMPNPAADDDFRLCADNYVCYFANLLGDSILIPDVLGSYRRHGANNFSRNPFVGGHRPLGDMRGHPRHSRVIATIRTHMLEQAPDFIRLLTKRGFARALAQVTPPGTAVSIFFRALFHSGSPVSAEIAAHLLILSTIKYTAFWGRRFTRKSPYVLFKFEPPVHTHQ